MLLSIVEFLYAYQCFKIIRYFCSQPKYMNYSTVIGIYNYNLLKDLLITCISERIDQSSYVFG